MVKSEFVYDTIAFYFADDIDMATIKYQKVSLQYEEGGAPSGEDAYPVIVRQLISEVEEYLRVGDKIGFFVFKRQDANTLSIHLKDEPFAAAILNGDIDIRAKNQLHDAIQQWKARAASEYGHGRKRYFGRKHLWLVARRTPTFIQTVQNPVTASDGHGGVVREYVDINEACEEGA